jgi:hypothetical protein
MGFVIDDNSDGVVANKLLVGGKKKASPKQLPYGIPRASLGTVELRTDPPASSIFSYR